MFQIAKHSRYPRPVMFGVDAGIICLSVILLVIAFLHIGNVIMFTFTSHDVKVVPFALCVVFRIRFLMDL